MQNTQSFRGAPLGASPESITTIWGYGFRACAQEGASRNDGERMARLALRPETWSRQRFQSGLDLGAPRLEEWRQRQCFAERFHRFVGRKSRAVGGDLEQDAVRLAEIQAAKIK